MTGGSEIIILAGVPGAGKTSVAELALQQMGDVGKEYTIVNFGNVLFELLKRDGIVKHMDEIRAKVDQHTYMKYQKLAAEKIASMGGRIIVTTHMSLMTPSGFFPGLPAWVLEKLKPSRIIIIEAPPEHIRKRQEEDRSRIRGYDFERDIEMYQNFNRMYAVAYSAMSGARLKIIQNLQGKLLEAAREFIKALEL